MLSLLECTTMLLNYNTDLQNFSKILFRSPTYLIVVNSNVLIPKLKSVFFYHIEFLRNLRFPCFLSLAHLYACENHVK
jgi:hypothetical protein